MDFYHQNGGFKVSSILWRSHSDIIQVHEIILLNMALGLKHLHKQLGCRDGDSIQTGAKK